MTDQSIVFIGGIHGAGKTTICRHMAKILYADHVTAGTLIRETAGDNTNIPVGIGSKTVLNLERNQDLLLRGLELFCSRNDKKSRLLLIDGHFTLLDVNDHVAEIPQEVFSAIEPIAVLLVEAAPETVHLRLTTRYTEAPSLEFISVFAKRERTRATEVSKALDVPMWIVPGEGDLEHTVAGAAQSVNALLGGVV